MEIGDLEDVLNTQDTFRALPQDEVTRLAPHLALHVFRLGDLVLEPATTDRALYIVYSGRARLIEERPDTEPATLAVLTRGETFGEHTLQRVSRAYSVRAASDLVVLRLDEAQVRRLASAYPAFRDALDARVQFGLELAFLSR